MTMTAQTSSATASQVGAELPGAVARLYRRIRAERADGQLGDTALSVLAFLAKHGPHTLRELSEHERVTPPSMNQTVNILAAAGLVVRTSDPDDGRKVVIRATPAGGELATAARERWHGWLDGRLEELGPEQLGTLLDAARILRELADS